MEFKIDNKTGLEARGSWFIYFYFGHFLLRRRRRTFVYNAHIISPELVYKCVSTKLAAKGAQKTNPFSTPSKQKNNNDLRTKTMTANPFNSLTSPLHLHTCVTISFLFVSSEQKYHPIAFFISCFSCQDSQLKRLEGM